MKRNCRKCGDTGINDLGNNDEPCECIAGDSAMFNDISYGNILGKDLKEKLKNSIDHPASYEAIRGDIFKDFEPRITQRPWGTYEVLFEDYKCKIKQIVVRSGQAISLQSHSKRDELWKLLQGEGEVIIDGCTFEANVDNIPNSYFIIRREAQHRITNTGLDNLVFIEIQTGESFDELDIQRFADNYGRV